MSRRVQRRQPRHAGAGEDHASQVADDRETHAVVRARSQMHVVADAYRELGRKLGGERTEGTVRRPPPGSRPPLVVDLAHARMAIEAWSSWLARAVLDARDAAGQPWTPRSVEAAALLREIADEHLGALTADPLAAADLFDACEAQVRTARAKAWPTGERWIPLGVPCPEVVGEVERTPCGGEYRMRMRPDQDVLGDMVCERNAAHRITPAEWQRAMRRRTVGSPAAAARLVRTMRLAGRPVAG